MRLKKVEPSTIGHRDYHGNPVTVKCGCCNCYNTIGDITEMYADLDGKPFESYYCENCKDDVESAILDEQQELLSKGQEDEEEV